MFRTLEVKENKRPGNWPVTSTKNFSIMKRISPSSNLKTVATVLVFCSVLFSCSQEKKDLKVITVSGCVFIDNVSMHNAKFGSLSDSGETSALLVSEGDILYALGETAGFIAYVRYKNEYGHHLEFTMDSTTPGFVRINDKIHSLYLDDDPAYSEWISTLSSEDLKGLSFLHLSGDSGKYDLSALELISETNPDLGLSVDNIGDMEQLYEILSMIHPTSLIIPDIELDSRVDDLIPNLANLEHLYMDGESFKTADFLHQLPDLKSLIISGWDPDGPNLAQFEEISTLESLTLIESGIKSLSALGDPRHLSALNLIDCSSLTDISHLKDMHGIQCLGLLDCDTLSNLSVLKEIPALQWLSFPPGIGQADFDDILTHHKSLKGVELLGCKNLTDISSLTRLQELKALAIGWGEIDYKTLQQLEGIELIVIEEESFSAAGDEIAALKEALPGAQIVPGGGFCMGSGWILLILPVFLLAFGYRRFIRN